MRIAKEIELEGKKARALFDTGSLHTYVSRWLLEGVPIRTLTHRYRVALERIMLSRHAPRGRIDSRSNLPSRQPRVAEMKRPGPTLGATFPTK